MRRSSVRFPATTSSWVLLLGFLLGALYALVMKPVKGPDEDRHMYRVFLVSSGICTGEPAIPVIEQRYMERFDHLDRQVTWIELPRNSTGRDILQFVDPGKLRPLQHIANFSAINLYSCVPYIPAAIAVRLGRTLTASPLLLTYWGRFGNLIFYLLMLSWAMRLLPAFELPLAVIALMPMALNQGASLSADAVTMAVAFVFAAYLLRLALVTQPSGCPFVATRRDYLQLAAAALAAGLCKADVGLVWLVLLIPAARFSRPSKRWLTVAGCVAVAYGALAAWQYVNRTNGEIFSTLKAADGIYLDENVGLIFRQPTLFLGAAAHSFRLMGGMYVEQFVGTLGGLDIRLPSWVPWVYLPLLLLVAIACHAGPRLLRWQRLLLAAIFLLNVASLVAVVWTTELQRTAIAAGSSHGDLSIPGLQGRYLIPFILLLLVAVSGPPIRIHARILRGRWLAVAALTLVAVVNAAALDTLWDTYQAHTTTLPNRLRMPLGLLFSNSPAAAPLLYENRAVTGESSAGTPIFLVTGGVRHVVSRWPYDVVRISDEDLAAIPMGSPIDAPVHHGYEGQLIRQADDTRVYVVRDGQKHWVWDGTWLTLRGYKPEDIHIIPAADLAAMPVGYALP